MMYIDYRKDEITNDGKLRLINTICRVHNIEKEVVIKYIEIYNEYPYTAFSDTKYLKKNVEDKLKIISRSFKIKKITKRNCAK